VPTRRSGEVRRRDSEQKGEGCEHTFLTSDAL
jgi:hypothetical protein